MNTANFGLTKTDSLGQANPINIMPTVSQTSPQGKFLLGTLSDPAEQATARALLSADSEPSTRTYEVVTVSGNVTKNVTEADPTAGNIVLALPDSSTVMGQSFTIKRVLNGNNYVEVDSVSSIDNSSATVRLGSKGDVVTFYADSSGYVIVQKAGLTYSSLGVSAPTTFALTTGFTKFSVFDDEIWSTPGLVKANATTSEFDVEHHSGEPVDGYRVIGNLALELANNHYVEFQMHIDGVPSGSIVANDGEGSGKPFTIPIIGDIGMLSTGSVALYARGEFAETLDVTAATLTMTRI